MAAIGAVVVGVILLVATVYVSSRRSTTVTEQALWTFIMFAIGILTSYFFGRQSVRSAAEEMVRTQARSATRRLRTLGFGIQGIGAKLEIGQSAADAIANSNGGSVPIDHLALMTKMTYLDINAQMQVVIDALEDWREFDPSIVHELKQERADDDS